MLRLLIADDEYLARHAFCNILNKYFPNIEIAGEAENGMDALEQTRLLKPDIIVIDIRMPGINGLASTEQILSEFPDTKIIIISAYDDFEYMQKAIELGAKAYFLKPFHPTTIVSKLSRIIECLENENLHKYHPPLEDNLLAIKKMVNKELVKSYISGGTLTKDASFYEKFFNYNIQQGYFIIVILKDLADSIREDSIHYTLFREKIINSISESLNYLCFHLTGNFMLNYIPIFISSNKQYNFATESLLISKEVLRKLNYHRLAAAISIGTIHNHPDKFHLSYQEALSTLFTLKTGEIKIFAPTAPIACPFPYPYQAETQLIDELRQKNIGSTWKTAKDIVIHIIASQTDLNLKKEYLTQLFASLKHTIHMLGFDMEPFHSKWPFSSFAYLENDEELLTFSSSYLDNLITTLTEQIQTPNYSLIRKTEQYINTHLTDASKLSLEHMATHLSLSPQYVSKIFKDQFAVTYTEYITAKRIELAKEYLLSPNNTIAQVAELTGYYDQNYFCRVFKKLTGMTPKEYRLSSISNQSL
jgi:Response regulator containing CheY-like receiver domain and AraC-type DNA-binding domain